MKRASSDRAGATGAAPATQRFRTTILTAGKTATGIRIPDEIVEKLGAGKRPPVRITINGYTYRSTVAVMGQSFMVGVNAENRAKAGVAGGDEVDVEIAVDDQPRDVEVPAVLATELEKDAAMRERFQSLSYSRKKALAQPIADAKTEATRQRHLERALAELGAAKQ